MIAVGNEEQENNGELEEGEPFGVAAGRRGGGRQARIRALDPLDNKRLLAEQGQDRGTDEWPQKIPRLPERRKARIEMRLRAA